MYTFDDLVFIGRFQPFHNAHLETILIALQQSQRVIIALGSAQSERNIKNPFLAIEREQMILSNFSHAEQKRIDFVHIIDVYDDQKWVAQVKSKVAALLKPQARVGLIGHFKDESSYYLSLFPEWLLVELEALHHAISATPIRETYYRGSIDPLHLPAGSIAFLQNFQNSPVYQQLQHKYFHKDSSNCN